MYVHTYICLGILKTHKKFCRYYLKYFLWHLWYFCIYVHIFVARIFLCSCIYDHQCICGKYVSVYLYLWSSMYLCQWRLCVFVFMIWDEGEASGAGRTLDPEAQSREIAAVLWSYYRQKWWLSTSSLHANMIKYKMGNTNYNVYKYSAEW